MDLSPELRLYFQKSSEAVERKQYDYAIELLNAILKESPQHAPAVKLLLRAVSQKNIEEAQNFVVIFANNTSAQISRLAARIAYLVGDPKKAHRIYVRGVTYSPRNTSIISEWLNLLMKQGWLDMAIVAAETLAGVAVKEDNFLSLANLHLEKGATDQAKKAIEQGLRRHPSSPKLLRRLKEIEAERAMEQGDWRS